MAKGFGVKGIAIAFLLSAGLAAAVALGVAAAMRYYPPRIEVQGLCK